MHRGGRTRVPQVGLGGLGNEIDSNQKRPKPGEVCGVKDNRFGRCSGGPVVHGVSPKQRNGMERNGTGGTHGGWGLKLQGKNSACLGVDDEEKVGEN